ncbi:pasiflora 1 isoform a-related [Holotrichia oblita]|uniref:Pasiflora 1 isoform a-related n=1 Tax=Holotrichia oblita TaxID=644536 RepID=A0ACB9SN79_HOLOL|nr:pasiflora 1 isoform a-related [Holotrichia oblita]
MTHKDVELFPRNQQQFYREYVSLEREKKQLTTLLCTADKDAAVPGARSTVLSSNNTLVLLPLEQTNSDRSCLPTVGQRPLLVGAIKAAGEAGKNHASILSRNNNTILLKDGAHLLEATQVEGAWPIDHPLPLPTWAAKAKQPLKFTTVWEYEELASNIEYHVQKILEEHNYNTVGNFLTLYQGFKRSGCSSLSEYYQSYSPPITSLHHTCVGLALELWKKLFALNHQFPNFTDHLYLVSCEEGVESLDYVALLEDIEEVSNILEKEHVLLALKFEISGRSGVLLCDPGYHVGRVVTVMHDSVYPHTAIDVTERRNLVYNFRSLLSRDTKGHLIAGIYFKVKDNSDDFTIFYHDGVKQRMKMNFSIFLYPELITEGILKVISKCNDQLNLKENELLRTLASIAEVLKDKVYLTQLLDINNCINNMTEAN